MVISLSFSRAANAKLNNFTRLEPVLHLLEIPFDTNLARDMMTEKFGVSTRLMYQVFIALHRKTKANLTGVAMETMRPAAPVKLEAVESTMYKEVRFILYIMAFTCLEGYIYKTAIVSLLQRFALKPVSNSQYMIIRVLVNYPSKQVSF